MRNINYYWNEIKNRSDISPDDVRSMLKDFAISVVPYEIPKGALILRARRGYGFTKRSEMTYCPAEKCQDYQRASMPKESMFYGVISDDQHHLEDARAICVAECSALCKEGKTSIGRERFTISHWMVTKPLRIVSLITDQAFPTCTNNKLLNQLRNTFVYVHGKSDSSTETKVITQFLSDEFTKDVRHPHEYIVSATISHDIVNNLGYDGIIYPSVQLGGQGGLNIAIKPSSLNKKVRFIRTLENCLYKNGSQSFIRMEKATERNGTSQKLFQISDEEICNMLNIKTLTELPIKE